MRIRFTVCCSCLRGSLFLLWLGLSRQLRWTHHLHHTLTGAIWGWYGDMAIWRYRCSTKSEAPPPKRSHTWFWLFRCIQCSYFPFFSVFTACTSYVMLEFHFCYNAQPDNCNILLRFLRRLPFIYGSVFHVVFLRCFFRFSGPVLFYILMCLLTVVEGNWNKAEDVWDME